eukprot:94602-Pelagomonas_calceolata.AAC.2
MPQGLSGLPGRCGRGVGAAAGVCVWAAIGPLRVCNVGVLQGLSVADAAGALGAAADVCVWAA